MVCPPSPSPSPTRGEGEHRVIFYVIPMAKIHPPLTLPLSPAGERDRVRGTTLIILNLHRAIRTKKVHGHSIAP